MAEIQTPQGLVVGLILENVEDEKQGPDEKVVVKRPPGRPKAVK